MARDTGNLSFSVSDVWKCPDPRIAIRTITAISNSHNPLSMVKYTTSGNGQASRTLRCTIEHFRYWIDKFKAVKQ